MKNSQSGSRLKRRCCEKPPLSHSVSNKTRLNLQVLPPPTTNLGLLKCSGPQSTQAAHLSLHIPHTFGNTKSTTSLYRPGGSENGQYLDAHTTPSTPPSLAFQKSQGWSVLHGCRHRCSAWRTLGRNSCWWEDQAAQRDCRRQGQYLRICL